MFAEPPATQADLLFDLAGIRIRVSAWFWVAAVLLGWGVCRQFSDGDQRIFVQMLAIWVGVVFVSILVHEMAHAMAFRTFGQSSHVVLYHFGGLAVPDGRRCRHLRPFQQLLVSAAGPLAQLFVAAMLVGGLKASGHQVPFPIAAVGSFLGFNEGRGYESLQAYALLAFLMYVNVCWPLLNLLPVPPLDGGQIVREGLLASGVSDGSRIASVLGVVVGGAVAWWGYARGDQFMGIMFAMLAASCFQSVSAGNTPWRRWN